MSGAGGAAPLLGALADIAAAAGRAAACDVALAHGGAESWRVPRSLDGEAGRALADLVGRRALVVHLAAAGLTTSEIARRLRIARRTVRRYRAGE